MKIHIVKITVAIVETGALSEKMGYDRGNYQYCVVALTGVKYSLTERWFNNNSIAT